MEVIDAPVQVKKISFSETPYTAVEGTKHLSLEAAKSKAVDKVLEENLPGARFNYRDSPKEMKIVNLNLVTGVRPGDVKTIRCIARPGTNVWVTNK